MAIRKAKSLYNYLSCHFCLHFNELCFWFDRGTEKFNVDVIKNPDSTFWTNQLNFMNVTCRVLTFRITEKKHMITPFIPEQRSRLMSMYLRFHGVMNGTNECKNIEQIKLNIARSVRHQLISERSLTIFPSRDRFLNILTCKVVTSTP